MDAQARESGRGSLHATSHHTGGSIIEFFSTFNHDGELTTPLSTGYKSIYRAIFQTTEVRSKSSIAVCIRNKHIG